MKNKERMGVRLFAPKYYTLIYAHQNDILKIVSFFLVLVFLSGCSQPKDQPKIVGHAQDEMYWWYDSPATKFWEGVPIGTGRFAAMVLGQTENETVVFNDETLWTGGPYNPNNPDGYPALENIRKAVLERDYVKATDESFKLGSIPMMVQYYQAMGTMNLHFEGHSSDKVTNYKRKLSMDSALVTVSYQLDGVNYKREVFASYPDQVVVMRVSADKAGKIDVSGWLTSLQPSATSRVEGDEVIMEGKTIENTANPEDKRILPSEVRWQSKLKIIPEGKSARVFNSVGDRLQVKDADAVTMILAGATNWVGWNDVSANQKERCDKYVANASRYSFSQLKQRHIEDYCPLFSTCKIDLGKNENAKLTTTARMERLRKGEEDPLYISQYFQFGRYLLLAAAREKTLAFNNHNIWLDNMEGRWRGRWTLNINIQECYWPVETTNLPNVNESLLLFVENLAQAGARTAKELYGCRGWTAHHGTDVWFNTSPTDGLPQHATWPLSGAWLMQQLFDHYLYDPDLEYLKKIYPLLKGSAEFFMDFMITDPETGWLVTCPSTSPENSFYTDQGKKASVSMGSSMDMQIVRRLFRDCITACHTLGLDSDFQNQLEAAVLKLPPHQIGEFGQLQEWLYDFKEVEVTHRHLSHLFAAYPDDDITIRKAPELARAVKTVLDRRGNINRGWSGAWKINLHARLGEPQDSYNILKSMLTEKSIHPYPDDSDITPSYEGNQGIQGITAGITEMLLQSHSNEINLLPALPHQWRDGSIQGVRAKGGYEVDIFWDLGRLKKARIRSRHNSVCRLRTQAPIRILKKKQVVEYTQIESNLIEFKTEKGMEYDIINGA